MTKICDNKISFSLLILIHKKLSDINFSKTYIYINCFIINLIFLVVIPIYNNKAYI